MHLVDATMFYGPRSGGVKRYLMAKHEWLSRHARNVRHTIVVPALDEPHDHVQACNASALKLTDGYSFPIDPFGWRTTLRELQPTLIEAADPYIPGWAARSVAAELNIPAIAFYHSDLPRMLATRIGHWIDRPARRYLRSLYAGFDLVLAPSEVMLQRLHQAGIEHAEIQPLGVDIECFQPDARIDDFRARLGLPANARLLVYAGRFAREKNISVLIEAVQRLGGSYHLLLVGGYTVQQLSSRVTILPYESHASSLACVLASCDVFVHAGDQETYGLVAAEALACGLPVVGVRGGAIPDLIDDCVGALAPRVTDGAIARAIDGIFARDLSALRRAARARAVTAHSWDHVFMRLLSRYSALLSHHDVNAPSTAATEVSR